MAERSRAFQVGWVLTVVVVAFFLIDGGAKVVGAAPAIEGTMELGFSEGDVLLIGALALLSTALYAFPGTAILGAALLTAYLGGAVSVHLLNENPLWSHLLFPVYLGGALWVALLLRDSRLRRIFPWRGGEERS
jgi:hypothetical protein